MLSNIWDYIAIEPVDPFIEYYRTPSNISFKKKYKCNSIWKKYLITEKGTIS